MCVPGFLARALGLAFTAWTAGLPAAVHCANFHHPASSTEEGFINTDQRYLKDDKHITNDDGTTAVRAWEGGKWGSECQALGPRAGMRGGLLSAQLCPGRVVLRCHPAGPAGWDLELCFSARDPTLSAPPPPFQLFSMVVGQRLITAHVGDSRAVMHDGRQGGCSQELFGAVGCLVV